MDAIRTTSLSTGQLIRAALMDSEAVAAMATDIFPVYKDKAILPYVRYQRVASDTKPVKGAAGADTVSVEVWCYGKTYPQALALGEAVREALDGEQRQDDELRMRCCLMTDSDEGWTDDAYYQRLIFEIKTETI